MSNLMKSIKHLIIVIMILLIKANQNKTKETHSKVLLYDYFDRRNFQNRRGTITDNRRGLIVKDTEAFWDEYWKQYAENILGNQPEIERRGNFSYSIIA